MTAPNLEQQKIIKKGGKTGLKAILYKKETGSVAAIILMSIILMMTTDRFLTVSNLFNVARQISTLSIAAVGMSFIIITGGIDLSVGSSVAMSAVVLAKLITLGVNPIVAILGAMLTGIFVGAVNGYLIAFQKLPPFVVTLGTMSAFRGLAMLLTAGWPITLIRTPEQNWFFFLGGGYLFNVIPMQAVIMTIILIIGSILLKKTVFGHHTYAVGGNERAATLAGISSKKVKFTVYTMLGLLCSIVAILTVSFVSTAEPTVSQGMEQDVIAAAVIGGCSLSGGEGSILGSLLGAITIGILYNGLTLLGASPFIQKILIGVVIISAVILSERVRKSSKV